MLQRWKSMKRTIRSIWLFFHFNWNWHWQYYCLYFWGKPAAPAVYLVLWWQVVLTKVVSNNIGLAVLALIDGIVSCNVDISKQCFYWERNCKTWNNQSIWVSCNGILLILVRILFGFDLNVEIKVTEFSLSIIVIGSTWWKIKATVT
jgi:hypothetical protein